MLCGHGRGVCMKHWLTMTIRDVVILTWRIVRYTLFAASEFI